MLPWASLCFLVICLNYCLGQLTETEQYGYDPNHYGRKLHKSENRCERRVRQLNSLLRNLLNVLERDEYLRSHPEIVSMITHYVTKYPELVNNPYDRTPPILKQKFVYDNFVEEGSEDDFPPTNEVVAQIFKDIRLLLRRKDKRLVPVGRIEDILLTHLRPFILFPIVKPCRKEKVETLLSFVRSAYLRYLETPCYDNAARIGEDEAIGNYEDRLLAASLKDYIWHKKEMQRYLNQKPKSCQTRALDYFLESIKIIVQLFIKNYDCHPEDDYNALPVKGFSDVYTETGNKIPRNTDTMSSLKNGRGYDDLDQNYFGKTTVNNPLFENPQLKLNADNSKFLKDAPYNFPKPIINKYDNNMPSGKDSVLLSPVRDDEKLRNKGVHLNDGGYGDMFYPFYNTGTPRKDESLSSKSVDTSLILDPQRNSDSSQIILESILSPEVLRKEIPIESQNMPMFADPSISGQRDSLFNLKGFTEKTINLNSAKQNNDASVLDMNNFQKLNQEGVHFAQFDSLINRPSVELPSFDQTNPTDVELIYVARHPKVLIYNPQYIIKQKMSYITYLQHLKEIYSAKHFVESGVQLLQVLKHSHNGEVIPLYQSNDRIQSVQVKDMAEVSKVLKDYDVFKGSKNQPLRNEPNNAPVSIDMVKSAGITENITFYDRIDSGQNTTAKAIKSKKSQINDTIERKNLMEESKAFVDETRSSKKERRQKKSKRRSRKNRKIKKQVHLYNTSGFDDIVNNFNGNKN